MLEDLSQHVLDIAENSVMAKATKVSIQIIEKKSEDLLRMTIADNGCGMSAEFVARVTDPFTTSRTTRRVGMGLPFLKQSAEMCEGSFRIDSTQGVGTTTEASFRYSSIDRPPLGDLPSTVMTLLMGNPEIDWTYTHITDQGEFVLAMAELEEALEDLELLRTPEIGLWLRDHVREKLDAIGWSSAGL